jgi:signal transduction histidine kinase
MSGAKKNSRTRAGKPAASRSRVARGGKAAVRTAAASPAASPQVTALELEVRDLRAEVEELQRASSLKDQYLAVATHELSAPLAAMKAYVEALIEGHNDPTFTHGEEFLRVLDRETTRLTRVVERTLELSRLARRQREVRLHPVDLAAVAAEVQASLRPLLAERHMTLLIEVAPEVPHAAGDPDLLKQVLVNLVHNSIKFSPPGSRVWLRVTPAGTGTEIEVRDEGHGIAPHEQEHVFEPWFRSADERVARARGTGLGLAIVKTIIEQHGTRIRVESQPNVGTSFRFTLSRY